MPKIAEGAPETMQCLLEKIFLAYGFQVVHDGEQAHEFPNAGKPSFYTRVLRLFIDNKPVDTWVRFTYNLRTKDADLSISRHDFIDMDRRLNEQLAEKSRNNSSTDGTLHVRQKAGENDRSPAGSCGAQDVEVGRTSTARQVAD